MQEPVTNDKPGQAGQGMPFVAPCRTLAAGAPWRWLRLGWADLRRAPRQSLSYGLAVVLASYLATWLALRLGGIALLLGMLSGFVFIGPLLAIAVYQISRDLDRGRTPSLASGLRAMIRQIGNELVFALVVLVVFLVWARAASMMHVFFPVTGKPHLEDMLLFLGLGSAVGSIFAAITFAIAAFSLPMIADRQTDAVTAVVTSVNAVLRNKPAMLVWIAIIVGAVAIGIATAFIGLAVLMPLIGHATWHAYRETIDASAWPMLGTPGPQG